MQSRKQPCLEVKRQTLPSRPGTHGTTPLSTRHRPPCLNNPRKIRTKLHVPRATSPRDGDGANRRGSICIAVWRATAQRAAGEPQTTRRTFSSEQGGGKLRTTQIHGTSRQSHPRAQAGSGSTQTAPCPAPSRSLRLGLPLARAANMCAILGSGSSLHVPVQASSTSTTLGAVALAVVAAVAVTPRSHPSQSSQSSRSSRSSRPRPLLALALAALALAAVVSLVLLALW